MMQSRSRGSRGERGERSERGQGDQASVDGDVDSDRASIPDEGEK